MLKKIAVILGGTSPEHEISLKSGRFIYETLSRDKYLVKAIPITKKGDWIIPVEFNHPMPELQKELQGMSETFMRNFREIIPVKAQTGDGMSSTDSDLVFIGLHGGEGENGTIQSILFARGIPFTGSGVLASALAMDKYRSNLLFKSVGLNVPEFIEINKI
ncbi:MAG: D-alanine--D-alanine ligase, partial [Leptospira sp.]|nr:D-alanine--D-alanine ligase [Leptospira sp.]